MRFAPMRDGPEVPPRREVGPSARTSTDQRTRSSAAPSTRSRTRASSSSAFLAVLDSETGFPVRANPIGDSADHCRVLSLSFGQGSFRLMGGFLFNGSCHLDPLSTDTRNNGFYASLVK
jgi:hypothetical protein